MTTADATFHGLPLLGAVVGSVFHVFLFDGCNYGFVVAIPSLRSANTDFPLQTPGSPAHLYKWVHNSADVRVTRAHVGKEQAYETLFGGIVASKTKEEAGLCQ